MQSDLLRRGEEIREKGVGTRVSVGRTCSESKRGNSLLRGRKKDAKVREDSGCSQDLGG